MFARRSTLACIVALAATAVAPLPVEAGHTFSAQGTASDGYSTVRISIGGQLDRFGTPGDSAFGVVLFVNDPLPTNPFNILVLESTTFYGRTNFIDGDTAPVVAQTDYWAESTTPGISFRLDGVRAEQWVTASGHYNQYEIDVGMNLV